MSYSQLSEDLADELHDSSSPLLADLAPCGQALVARLQTSTRMGPGFAQNLDELAEIAYKEMLASRQSDPIAWRRLYTDTNIVRSLADLVAPEAPDEDIVVACIARLDRILIIAGAPGDGRRELVLSLISQIQGDFLPSRLFDPQLPVAPPNTAPLRVTSVASSVPRLTSPPSLFAFQRLLQAPFVLPGFACDWPALNEHPWNSHDYLKAASGRGRIVPVEVGGDYRADDWTQKMMPWDEFLDALEGDAQPILYMAQHNLLAQFPALMADIVVPDYVYTAPPPPAHYPSYRPPANEEQLVINSWLGPGGTTSPAHTDPYYDLFAQVVGRKTVWLAPPDTAPYMYPYPPTSSSHNPATNQLEPSMSNTTRIDVFADESHTRPDFPEFWEKVVPKACSVTLEPGDVLFFPPGWWHAMRSEEKSFSVSMWF